MHVEVAGIAFQPVRVNQVEDDGRFVCRFHVPYQIVHPLESAVKGVLPVVVGRRFILDAVDHEGGVADAVGDRAHARSEETLARRRNIVLDIVVADNDARHFSVLVRRKDGNHPRTEIGDLHGDVSVLKGVKRNGLPVNFRLESLGGHQFYSGIATSLHQSGGNYAEKQFFHKHWF